jgi:hypothetical protein
MCSIHLTFNCSFTFSLKHKYAIVYKFQIKVSLH